MIQSKDDFYNYILADRIANKIDLSFHMKFLITWRYLICLRKVEYVNNCKHGFGANLLKMYLKIKLYRLSVKSGLTIPINTFGKGLYIPHHGAIVVNSSAKFGDDCVIQNGVNISSDVVGGNHVYLGAGSKVMIGVIIGANSVVTHDVSEDNVVVAGAPAKIVSYHGFNGRKKI